MAKRKEIKVYAREWREKLGWTLEDAAAKVPMSYSYLSDLEKGTPGKRWNIETLAKLGQAYGLDDPRDLFTDPGHPDPILSLVGGLSKDDRETAERVLTAILKKTGPGS